MRIRYLPLVASMSLLAVVAVGCDRMTPQLEAELRQSFGLPANMPLKDFGGVEFRPGQPRKLPLGGGRECTITVTVLTPGQAQMTLLYASPGGVIDGVRRPPHSQRSQLVFRPESVPAGWRICAGPFEGSALALRPIIVP
jgi:hypothetical protein